MFDVTGLKWPKDPSVQRGWKTLVRRERKIKTGKKVQMLNLTRNSRHFNKEKISTDDHRSADLVYFAWNNLRKPLAQERLDRHISAKPPDECEGCSLPRHVPRYPGSLY